MYAARLTFISCAPPSNVLPLATSRLNTPSHFISEQPTNRFRTTLFRPHRGCRAVACDSSAPYSSPDQPPRDTPNTDTSSRPKATRSAVSRTLIGRALVEIVSLIVGATLLLIVVAWRASQVVSLAAWRALLWLANLRRLGKWACIKLVDAPKRLPSVSALRAARDAFFTILTRQEPKTTFIRDEELPNASPDVLDDIRDVTSAERTTPSGRKNPGGGTLQQKRRLILVRHAKTVWDRNNEVPDHERTLSPQGKEEAQLVGTELATRSWFPDKVLCSNAIRTVQTLNLLSLTEQRPESDTLCTESLYYAVTGEEMAVAVDEALGTNGFVDHSTLMVVCHNPGCEELVEQLTGHRPQMGTGCAVMLEYEASDDKENDSRTFRLATQQQQWTLVDFLRPSELSAASSHAVE